MATAVLVAAALSCAGLLTVAVGRESSGRLSVSVLDVGQGDAILVQGPRGGRMLVDGGPDPERLLGALDGKLPPWDRRLDLVVLTHPHEDHVGGLPVLLERYQVGRLAEPGMRGPGPAYRELGRELARERRTITVLAAGDRLRVDGADIRVLWPRRGGVPREPGDTGKGINNVSIVLDVRFGQRRFLLAGDVEEEIDPELLRGGIAGERVDLLKVAHHGSATATSDAFLAAVRPRVAVASAGIGNPYGHPSPRTLQRIAATGARVFRTDRDGSVTASTDGSDLHVSTSGPRPVAAARTAGFSFAARFAFGCGIPASPFAAPRIARWPSPGEAKPRAYSSSSIRRTGM